MHDSDENEDANETIRKIRELTKEIWVSEKTVFLRCIEECRIDYAAVISTMKLEIEEKSKSCIHDLTCFERKHNSLGCYKCCLKYNCEECYTNTLENRELNCSFNSYGKEFSCATCSRNMIFWVCEECGKTKCIC